jgi:hypothetical protein
MSSVSTVKVIDSDDLLAIQGGRVTDVVVRTDPLTTVEAQELGPLILTKAVL